MNEFSEGIRTQNVLIVADDVLEPEVMRKLDIISKEIQNIKVTGETGEEIDLDKLCFQ